ncbi:hypothetical protein BCR39DRAFT_347272 [Naematelia encephala]|uniref:Uncharacterized protein n=1 Tax=Naematelia encephala TaxID=71784 RepID=A0A1Y2AM20_9TREE|nr:hypothetical protein BCR39DRAFT_347272 [Naematelia encephala]
MAETATASSVRGTEWPRSTRKGCLVDISSAKVTSPTKVVRSASSTSLPRSDSTKFSPVKYPVLSTRQSSINTPRRLIVSPLPLQTVLPAPTTSGVDESYSTSALMPHLKNMSGSLIDDDSANAPSSSGDSSLDFNIDDLRPPKRGTTGLPRPEELGYANERNEHGGSTTPTQSKSTMKPSATMWSLKESTLLPEFPAKSAYIRESNLAISNVQPPWEDDSQSVNGSPVRPKEVFMSPIRQTSRSSPSPSLSRRVPPSSTRSKRYFPASSSAQTLDSLSEEPAGAPSANLDKSVLLPMSPNKARPEDHESLLRMSLPLDELSMSMNIPLPEPTPRSHRKSIRPMMQDSAEKTMDIGELMALMRKPKRASGTEESFADLLHGDDAPEGMDQ